MPVHIADTRNIGTLDDARQIMTDIRRLTCEREIHVARAEKRIAGITADAMTKTEPLDAQITELAEELSSIIMANKDSFQRPRMIVTPDGKFGLRSAVKVEITDPDAALDVIFDRGYDECIKTTRSFVKDKIRVRLAAGEHIKGCRLEEGEIASYTVTKALIEEARNNA